ncbi:unnamed protein product [Peniophora sp. CBMAI 1063]|nr:unnamed protein product [Peniophora sp. CBMAI 1063]
MQPNFQRRSPPPPLALDSAAPSTSFVFTSSQYQASSPSSRHSRHASLSSKLLKEHALGAFGARQSPESILPPGFVQLASNTTSTTQATTQATSTDPVPSSSRPLWLPRFATGAHQPPPAVLSTLSDSPTHESDSYFPPQHSFKHGTSTGNTSPVCSTASSPVTSLPVQSLPNNQLRASPRRTTGHVAHELSLTELMNGTNAFGSSDDIRDRAGPRYQTMPRPPRPSPKAHGERKLRDKGQVDQQGLKRHAYSSDSTIVIQADPIDSLKSELRRLSVTTNSVPEGASSSKEDIAKGGDKTEPDVTPFPLSL